MTFTLDKLEKYLNEQASYKKQQEIDQEEAAEMVRKEIENLQELVEAGVVPQIKRCSIRQIISC